ncbi:MAG: FkbM family methyltransferase [Bacteroidetes bacterium]|nr:FkbM family methyltransferase [Bacteroidota bacterium]
MVHGIVKWGADILSSFASPQLWKKIHRRALAELNFGNGGDFTNSGEKTALDFIKQRLSKEPGITVFDGGSNIGNYAKYVANLFGDRCTVFCFEPARKTFESLCQNTRSVLNIKTFNMGLSNLASRQPFFTHETHTGLASVYQRRLDVEGNLLGESEEVSMTTIDDFCATHNVNHIHFLKLDIEGHELAALQGAQKLLSRGAVDVIQFEFGSVNIDSRTYFRDFYNLLHEQFEIYRIGEKMQKIDRYDESMEVFLTTNYLATKKV